MDATLEMPRKQKKAEPAPADNDLADTTLVRVNADLAKKIAVVVKRWRATRPASRFLTTAKYLDTLLRGPVEHDFGEVVGEMNAEVTQQTRRRPS